MFLNGRKTRQKKKKITINDIVRTDQAIIGPLRQKQDRRKKKKKYDPKKPLVTPRVIYHPFTNIFFSTTLYEIHSLIITIKNKHHLKKNKIK